MGASHSTAGEKVFTHETPIQFSPDIVDQLAANLNSTQVPPERQSTLDAHVRARIHSELEHLRKEEEDVRQKIEQALEKENLDRERAMTGEGSETGAVKDSVSLLNDLEAVRNKVDRFHAQRDLQDFPDLKSLQESVLTCYKNNTSTTLDCWREVGQFKAAVNELEQKYVKSLQ